jgi:hypothetical protein
VAIEWGECPNNLVSDYFRDKFMMEQLCNFAISLKSNLFIFLKSKT